MCACEGKEAELAMAWMLRNQPKFAPDPFTGYTSTRGTGIMADKKTGKTILYVTPADIISMSLGFHEMEVKDGKVEVDDEIADVLINMAPARFSREKPSSNSPSAKAAPPSADSEVIVKE